MISNTELAQRHLPQADDVKVFDYFAALAYSYITTYLRAMLIQALLRLLAVSAEKLNN